MSTHDNNDDEGRDRERERKTPMTTIAMMEMLNTGMTMSVMPKTSETNDDDERRRRV